MAKRTVTKLRVATVATEGGARARLVLIRDPDAFRWYEEETGADTEVSAPTLQRAVAAACMAWPGSAWDLKLGARRRR